MRHVFLIALAFLAVIASPAQAGAGLPDALQSHSAMVLLVDPADGLIVDANDAAAAFYGYGLEQLRTMRIQEINQLAPEEVAAEFRRAREEQRNYFVFPHRLASGAVRTVEVHSSPFVDASGQTLLLSIIHDATGKMLLEKELLRYQTRMEELVALRTDALLKERSQKQWIALGAGGVLVISLALVVIALMLRRSRDQLALNGERQELLLDLDKMVNASQQELLDFALEASLKAAQSRIAFVGLLDDDESGMALHAWSKDVLIGCGVQDTLIHFPIVQAGLWGDCVRHRRPFFVNDYTVDHPGRKGCPTGHVPIIRMLAVPVFYKERIVAVVTVANKEGDYTGSDSQALTVLLQRVWSRLLRNRDKDSLLAANREIELLLGAIPSMLVRISPDKAVVRWNETANALFGVEASRVLGRPLGVCPLSWQWPVVEEAIEACILAGEPVSVPDLRFVNAEGKPGVLELIVSAIRSDDDRLVGVLIQGRDVTRLRQMESQLLQAQKLEAIGQLAAGIAHEINTPAQFVGDNVQFLRQAFEDLQPVLNLFGELLAAAGAGRVPGPLLERARAMAEDLDMDFLRKELPLSIEHIQEGIGRISNVVRSMKEYAHPGGREKLLTDLNRMLENTLVVARSEYKYVADLEMDLDPDLPQVICLTDDIKQAFLNVVINATHAIQEKIGSNPQERGRIRISTAQSGDHVEIRISDTGTGIPESIRSRVFDPFFTTKPVGKGTGQGLSIVYSTIVDKHAGTITFETEEGKGTTFIIRLPVEKDTAFHP
ncbi:MAG: GAF domain-containing protein [Pseudodesulfovibrio sp.]|uniref:histidine kinase n=2 Tax=Pseudodesulfovibrio aespoeensis TaxID=182210 RepID=E6VZI7_PSEA9|nr:MULTISPECIES: GAF domain-containing protein [Pseudodesulfovibrio]ADU61701.1 PAS sensor protein [Pseudodesulfovibrio aespoeensis Aspo-2]MBU4244260.1 GAF domain-containing protein [Pseudomonadota bacterium]MBU4377548.1 GAF domain-containing protein [Pseudomonadota bacterium]MBU4474891.1 GAF domain-containing protein [Pseudomonadota bacterium]MBU4517518.1 GAF domain-containing protein [Pseudomonadota bacterium]